MLVNGQNFFHSIGTGAKLGLAIVVGMAILLALFGLLGWVLKLLYRYTVYTIALLVHALILAVDLVLGLDSTRRHVHRHVRVGRHRHRPEGEEDPQWPENAPPAQLTSASRTT